MTERSTLAWLVSLPALALPRPLVASDRALFPALNGHAARLPGTEARP